MTDLRPCVSCQRHVEIVESTCPFCSAALEPGSPRASMLGRVSRAAVFGAALAGTAACGGKKAKPDTKPPDPPATVDAGTTVPDEKPDDRSNVPMPYGAPPARRRIV